MEDLEKQKDCNPTITRELYALAKKSTDEGFPLCFMISLNSLLFVSNQNLPMQVADLNLKPL